MVDSTNLITKVYFPRLIIPLSAALGGLVDVGVGFVLLAGMMLIYRVQLSSALLALPFFLLLAIVTALAKRLPVAFIPEKALVCAMGNDVINDRRGRELAVAPTLRAERVLPKIPVAGGAPAGIISALVRAPA